MSLDKNGIEVSDFLDVKFFENVLRTGMKDPNIKINIVKFTMGHTPGENYCSVIYRADVTYTKSGSNSETIPLIIKTQLQNIDFNTDEIFEKEINMYSYALPKMQAALQDEQIAPVVYFSSNSLPYTIILQDMTPAGYVVGDRINGLDEEHCAMVFRKLAKYHAASMELQEKSPKALEMFREGMKPSDGASKEVFQNLLMDTITSLLKVTKDWPGFETISKKLVNLKDIAYQKLVESIAPQDDEIKVLTHNDLWVNNILFKYDNDKLVDALLIDFQASYFCSPGIDITHFLYTSPQYQLLESKRDYMIEKYYYRTFKATLETIGFSPIPSLQDIFNEIEKKELAGFMWGAICKFHLICMDKKLCGENSIANLSDAEKGASIRAIAMASERYQTTMKYVLKRVDKLGLLDV